MRFLERRAMSEVPLLEITNAKLNEMSKGKKFVARYGFLARLLVVPQPKSSCGTCGSGRALMTPSDEMFNAAKTNIARLDDDSKRMLKKMLGAAKVRVNYRRGRDMVKLTF